jgi:hypothetical protein
MTNSSISSVKGAASINIIAGAWLFISPWVYRAYMEPSAWNSWIVGAAIVLLAAIRVSNPETTRGLSVVTALLGAWTFVSPWVYAYSFDKGRFINSLCVGLIVFILGVAAASSSTGRMMNPPPLRS